MNILGAEITTSEDGVALDVFRLSHAEYNDRMLDEDHWLRVRETLGKVLREEATVESLLARSQRPSILTQRKLPTIPTSVTFDNEGSDHYTLLEVSTQDGIGVLFAITNTLYRLGCVIHLAKISTVLHHVFDVFYITDGAEKKIVDEGRLREIAEEVRTRLDQREPSAAGNEPVGEITF